MRGRDIFLLNNGKAHNIIILQSCCIFANYKPECIDKLSFKIIKHINSSTGRKVILFAVTLLAFAMIYSLNVLYPIYLDDWDYSYIYWQSELVGGFFDAVYSQTIHYVKWGGRTVVHVILQTLLSWGPFWSDLLNSIMFVLFTAVVYSIANIGRKVRPSLYFMIIMLTWFFQADVGETLIWLTGSVNYMWGTTIILVFVYFYYKYFRERSGRTKIDSKGRIILFFFFGVIAGWTNENMVVAMLCMIAVFLFLVWRKEKSVEKWAISGFSGACIGAALMVLAPGNYVRYNMELKEQGLTKAELGIDYYWGRLQALIDGYMEYLLLLVFVYFLLVLVFWYNTEKEGRKEVLLSSFIFFGGSLIASAAMVASPTFEPRAWFGIITLMIVAVSIIYANLNFSKIYIRIGKWCCITLLFGMFVYTYVEGREELVHLRQIIDNREAELKKQKSEGKSRIIFSGERFEDRAHRRLDLIFPKMYDFPQDTSHWMYKAYERYHGVDAVRFENERSIKR
ncbi:DUF6056 family protein [Dysgonomonas sp. 520]|uniref:DUF3329 domain-containing protein n=1 Tax=Dysgonomonas sp. 520 TaxID=2302931 RepID=UPI0021065C50|nr:DUF6056 family protein [Dysgonomonas sp. 520]